MQPTTEVNEYHIQANNFLKSTNSSIVCEYLKTGIYFDGDEDVRDIYQVTISRNDMDMVFNFGQSIRDSKHYRIVSTNEAKIKQQQINRFLGDIHITSEQAAKGYRNTVVNKLCGGVRYEKYVKVELVAGIVPHAYDILTCLTKYPTGTFEQFCDEFGYNTDSRKAMKVYNACTKEYNELCTLFNSAELELMQEIQ